jgi:hypothetical protein
MSVCEHNSPELTLHSDAYDPYTEKGIRNIPVSLHRKEWCRNIYERQGRRQPSRQFHMSTREK